MEMTWDLTWLGFDYVPGTLRALSLGISMKSLEISDST